MRNLRSILALAFFSGAVAALGHAPFGIWPATVLGLACLIWLVAGDVNDKNSNVTQSAVAPRHRAGWIAWCAGAGYFGVSMHWIVEPFLVDAQTHGWMAPFALILLAGGLALFWALAGWLSKRLASSQPGRAFAFAVLLTAAELTRGHIFTGFPWALPAYVWAETPLRAATAYTGSYGLTFLMLVALALPTVFSSRLLGVLISAAVFGGLYALGASHMDYDQADARDLGTVRLVQPNVPQSEKWVREKVPEHLDRLMSLTGEAADQDQPVDLVVWPEAAVVYPLESAGPILQDAARAAQTGAGDGAEVLLGINRQSATGGWHNAMALVGADGAVADTYDKVHLVPFGEYIPFKIEFLRAMAATPGFGFSPGTDVRLLETKLGKAMPLICYEGIFPGQIFKADARADYLLLITNDAWFGTFSGPYQHLDQARFRAAEHGLPLVRVANTGISTVIDRFGQMDQADSIPLGQGGYRDVRVWNYETRTYYSRFGDNPLLVILFITLTGLTIARRRNAIANRRTTS